MHPRIGDRAGVDEASRAGKGDARTTFLIHVETVFREVADLREEAKLVYELVVMHQPWIQVLS